MSDWHDEIELALLPLEDLRVDSVYMTFVISNALSERGIFHQCRIGYAEDRLSRMTTAPHCWVELEQDLRAMTNDAYSKVKPPWLAGQAAAA